MKINVILEPRSQSVSCFENLIDLIYNLKKKLINLINYFSKLTDNYHTIYCSSFSYPIAGERESNLLPLPPMYLYPRHTFFSNPSNRSLSSRIVSASLLS